MRDRRLHDRFGVSWQVHPWLAEPGRAVGYGASFDAQWLSHTMRPTTFLRPGWADVVSLASQALVSTSL